MRASNAVFNEVTARLVARGLWLKYSRYVSIQVTRSPRNALLGTRDAVAPCQGLTLPPFCFGAPCRPVMPAHDLDVRSPSSL